MEDKFLELGIFQSTNSLELPNKEEVLFNRKISQFRIENETNDRVEIIIKDSDGKDKVFSVSTKKPLFYHDIEVQSIKINKMDTSLLTDGVIKEEY